MSNEISIDWLDSYSDIEPGCVVKTIDTPHSVSFGSPLTVEEVLAATVRTSAPLVALGYPFCSSVYCLDDNAKTSRGILGIDTDAGRYTVPKSSPQQTAAALRFAGGADSPSADYGSYLVAKFDRSLTAKECSEAANRAGAVRGEGLVGIRHSRQSLSFVGAIAISAITEPGVTEPSSEPAMLVTFDERPGTDMLAAVLSAIRPEGCESAVLCVGSPSSSVGYEFNFSK